MKRSAKSGVALMKHSAKSGVALMKRRAKSRSLADET
jgi:hypothetical protein